MKYYTDTKTKSSKNLDGKSAKKEFSSASNDILRPGECAVGIVGRGCGPNAACWRFKTRGSWYGNGVCIPSTRQDGSWIPNECLPSGIWSYTAGVTMKEHCCNGMRRYRNWGLQYFVCT